MGIDPIGEMVQYFDSRPLDQWVAVVLEGEEGADQLTNQL